METLTIRHIDSEKRRFMPLLLEGDESEAMIDRYLDRGTLYVGFIDNEAVAVCVTTEVDSLTVEVKNLAVDARMRKRGIGRRMLSHVESLNRGKTVILGTGETPATLRFYRSLGYSFTHSIPNFFTDNYPHPIIEEGHLLRDMLYFSKKIPASAE